MRFFIAIVLAGSLFCNGGCRLMKRGLPEVQAARLLPTNKQKGARYITVKPGDTLFAIAQREGTTVYSLQLANHLSEANQIYAGMHLWVPGPKREQQIQVMKTSRLTAETRDE